MKWLKYSFLLALPLSAEVFGPLEYELPKLEKEWHVLYERDQTMVYTFQNDGSTFFGLNRNTMPTNLDDIEGFKKSYQSFYPEGEVEMQILTREDNFLIFEWTVLVNGEEKIHGWGKTYTMPEETLLAVFQTENIKAVDELRPKIIECLKEMIALSPKAE